MVPVPAFNTRFCEPALLPSRVLKTLMFPAPTPVPRVRPELIVDASLREISAALVVRFAASCIVPLPPSISRFIAPPVCPAVVVSIAEAMEIAPSPLAEPLELSLAVKSILPPLVLIVLLTAISSPACAVIPAPTVVRLTASVKVISPVA